MNQPPKQLPPPDQSPALTGEVIDPQDVWRNRIVGYGEEAPDQLLASPRNWRIHPYTQQQALEGILRQVGIVQNVIVNQRTGCVVDGHMRVAVAISAGQPSLPITYVDLSDEEEAMVLATFDPLGAVAGADPEQYKAILLQVDSGNDAVRALLSSTAEAAGVLFGAVQNEADSPFATFDQGAGTAAFDYGQHVTFQFGEVRGQVARPVYDTFRARYEAARGADKDALLDDILRGWLHV